MSRGKVFIGVLLAAGLVLAGGLSFQLLKDSTRYTHGGTLCSHICWQRDLRGLPPHETQLWQGSQHKQAMDHATEKAVLGDFSDVTFDYYGARSRFIRKGGKFLVETDGPDGKLATFEVKYTFGVDPLQQYLIEFPDGRLQALSMAWDSRPKKRAVSAGSISIRTRRSVMMTSCTGPS